jgi:hypothetical protein
MDPRAAQNGRIQIVDARMMVTPVNHPPSVCPVTVNTRSSRFTRPDYQRVVEQPSFLQILNESRGLRLIDLLARRAIRQLAA